ncbi:hypothetical protein AAMO2058_001752800 [Amorphochlora amoebiformis]
MAARTPLQNSPRVFLGLLFGFLLGGSGLGLGLVAGKRVVTGKVHVLDKDTFEHDTQASTGATTGDWFVKFYAPWCGHCRKLEPTWEGLAKKLKKKVTVAKVDVTANQVLGQRFDIEGFPTLLFFHNGKMYKYKGKRSLDALEKFALGGYNRVEGKDVPKAPSVIITFLLDLFEQYTKLLNTNMPLALGIIVGFSFALALLIVLVLICVCDPPKAAGSMEEKKDSKDAPKPETKKDK